MGSVQGDDSDEAQMPSMDSESYDDSDVPSSAVIHDALGLDINSTMSTQETAHCVANVQHVDGGLVAGGDEENMWAWDKTGEKWGETLPTVEEEE